MKARVKVPVPQYREKLDPVASAIKNIRYAVWCSAKHSLKSSKELCGRVSSPLTALSTIVATTAAAIAATSVCTQRIGWSGSPTITDERLYLVFEWWCLGAHAATASTAKKISRPSAPILMPPDGLKYTDAAKTAPIPIIGSIRAIKRPMVILETARSGITFTSSCGATGAVVCSSNAGDAIGLTPCSKLRRRNISTSKDDFASAWSPSTPCEPASSPRPELWGKIANPATVFK